MITLTAAELEARPRGASSTIARLPTPLHLALAAAADVQPCVAPCPILRPDLANAMLPLINQHRAGLHAGALQIDPRLQACADWKSLNMASYLYLDHNDPLPVARSWAERVAVYYPLSRAGAGENIAYGYLDAAGVMQAFLSDVGHKANVENGSWVGCGLSVAQTAGRILFWTQDYGTDAVPGPIPPPPPPPPPPSRGPAVGEEWKNNQSGNLVRVTRVGGPRVYYRVLRSGKTTSALASSWAARFTFVA